MTDIIEKHKKIFEEMYSEIAKGTHPAEAILKKCGEFDNEGIGFLGVSHYFLEYVKRYNNTNCY